MLQVATSGQGIGFAMISALSGSFLTGLSGLISGYKVLDGNTQVGISGNIIERGFGQYWCNLNDYDTSGRIISYLFLGASGAIPVEKTGITTWNVSGDIYTASGIWPASGAYVNATATVTSGQVFLASGQAVSLNSGQSVLIYSGQSVLVYSGQLSGQPIAGLSGYIYTASGIWGASGEPSVVPIASISGVNAVVPISTLSGVVANSGLFVNVPIASISGNYSVVPPATLSGVTVIANVTLWQGVAPNSLLSSGRLDAAFNIRTNVARSGTANTIQLDAGVVTGVSGQYDNQIITIVGGTGVGQSRVIANMGSSGIAFIYPNWYSSGVPDNTSIFTITEGSPVLSGQVESASGAYVTVPISTLSGVQPISGTFVSVPISSISGAVANSGLFVTVLPANLSGVVANSGLFVTVPVASISGVYPASGSLSGQLVTLLSGFSYPASGVYTVASVSINSGTLYLASGQAVSLNSGQSVLVYSGQLSGQPIAGLSGYIYPASGIYVNATAVVNSGVYVTVPISSISGVNVVATATINSGQIWLASGQAVSLNSGQSVLVYSGQLSGQQINLTSGQSYPASGIYSTVPISSISGVNTIASVTAISSGLLSGQQVTLTSGQSYPASGIYVNAANISINSGQIYLASGQSVSLNSGQSVLVYSGQLSGQPIAGLSGYIYPASGINSVVPPSTLSGVVANSGLYVVAGSGLYVTVPISTLSGVQPISGTYVTVLPANLSGVVANSGLFVTATATINSGQVFLASGQSVSLNSGQSVLVYSGQLSGQPVGATSGLYVIVGQVLDKSGYTLSSSGLDTIQIETGVNMRQAQSLIAAATAGQLSGAGTTTARFAGANVPSTNRIAATVDQSGNRLIISLNPPT